MKNVKSLLFVIVAVLCLTSCNKEVKPVSGKINGPLGSFFEVVSRSYDLKSGTLNVEFKRIAEGGPNEVSNSKPTFTVEVLDGDGDVIASRSTDVTTTKEQLETVFSLGLNQSASISFKFDGSLGSAEKFKVSSKWYRTQDSDSESYTEAEPDEEPVYESESDSRTVTLSGSIGSSMGVMMTLYFDTYGDVIGAYYYKRKGPGALLYLKGSRSGSDISLNEYNKNGELTGLYDGTFDGNEFTGTFESYKEITYSFRLTKTSNFSAVDLSGVDFDEFTSQIFYGHY